MVGDYFAGSGTLSLRSRKQAGSCMPSMATKRARRACPRGRAAGLALTVETRASKRGTLAGRSQSLCGTGSRPAAHRRRRARASHRAIADPLVIAVSCNPETFARDARTLEDGGYRLGEVQRSTNSYGRPMSSWWHRFATGNSDEAAERSPAR